MTERLMNFDDAFDESIAVRGYVEQDPLANYASVSDYLDRGKQIDPTGYRLLLNLFVEYEKLVNLTSDTEARSLDLSLAKYILEERSMREQKIHKKSMNTGRLVVKEFNDRDNEKLINNALKRVKVDPHYRDYPPIVFKQLKTSTIASHLFHQHNKS